jgi:hydroxyacylglutathione hydrolase
MTSVTAIETPTGMTRILQMNTPGLGDSSYVILSAGEIALIDPQRDLDRFREIVKAQRGRPVAVLETHVHNDYVSGGPALASEFGAEYVVAGDADYALPHRAVQEGDEIRVGAIRLRPLFTPGHTPHHLSHQLVEEGAVVAVFTGGSVLVGACGRTDLIAPDRTRELTRQQYRSAQRIAHLPDPTALAPTHGAGSFCAASAGSSEGWTTVAKERTRNPGFLAPSEDAFVQQQLSGLGAYPDYYRHMAALNRAGQSGWELKPLPLCSPEQFEQLQTGGAVVVDARPRRAFAGAHIPGAVNVELDHSFAIYLGWLFPLGTRFALVRASDQDAGEAARQAARIGLGAIEGVLDGGIEAWQRSGRPIRSYGVTDVDGLHRALEDGSARALDVRQDHEWRAGHVPGARHVHVPDLPGMLGGLLRDRRLYPYCASGHRAAIAASLLDAAGVAVELVDGGFADWRARGYPVALLDSR